MLANARLLEREAVAAVYFIFGCPELLRIYGFRGYDAENGKVL